MQYLVSTDHFGGPPPAPDQMEPLLKSVVGSLEVLSKDKRVASRWCTSRSEEACVYRGG